MRRAVYAGSFDPLTNGHLWMIAEGERLFDELVVAVGINPDKRCAFELNERLAMLREAVGGREGIVIDHFEHKFLVNYAAARSAGFILRGIRSEADYAYERGMRHLNADLNGAITSVFLMPPRDVAEVSSSFVKGLVGPEGWREVVGRFVPRAVYERLLRKFGNGE